MRPRETQHVHGADHEARIEGLLAREVPHASGTRACAEAREIQRDHAPPTRRERAYDRAPVLGPSADAVNEKDRIAGRTVSALFKYTSTQALDRDRARLHLWVSCSVSSRTGTRGSRGRWALNVRTCRGSLPEKSESALVPTVLHVVHVLVGIFGDLWRIEESRHIQLRGRLTVRREQKVHVVALG